VTSATETDHVLSSLEAYLDSNTPSEEAYGTVREFGLNGAVSEYYHEDTLEEALLARAYFPSRPLDGLSPSESLVMASLPHVLHGNRPYALSRRSHPITPDAPSGDFEYRPVIPRVEDKVERSLDADVPSDFRAGDAFQADSTKWWPLEIDDLDAVVTSPPFYGSTRFCTQNWLRPWFVGREPDGFDVRPTEFVGERQTDSFEIHEPLVRQSRERLADDGVLVLHLGRSDGCDMAEEVRSVAVTVVRELRRARRERRSPGGTRRGGQGVDDEPPVPRPPLIGRAVGHRIPRSRRVGRVRGPTR
jgi:hypothetical protein